MKLEIRDTDNSILGLIDIGNDADFPFTLTKRLASLNDISKRGGAYSKTFKVPSTKENNKLLHYLYSSNQRVVKGFRKRKTANILVDDIIIERGYIKITDIEVKNKTEYYVITFFGDNVQWMTDLAEVELPDLTYANNTQTYTTANIVSSWSATYPTNDHVYPWISYGEYENGTSLTTEDFVPSIRYIAIIENSLNKAGFTLSSTFLNTANFKQLIFPFVGEGFLFSQAFVDDKLFKSSLLSSNQLIIGVFDVFLNPIPTKLIFNDDSTGDNFDTGGNFNITTNQFTAPDEGLYRFDLSLEILYADQNSQDTKIKIFKNNTDFQTINSETPQSMSISSPVIIKSGYYILNMGDTIDIRVEYPTIVGRILFGFNSYFKLTDMSREIRANATYNISDVLPKIKVLDLFADLTKLFNLYWLTDNKTKTVYVEERDSFFKAVSQAKDWTSLLAIDKEHKIKFITSYKRNLLFKYAEDSNDKYLEKRNADFKYDNNLYSSYKHTFPDRFRKGQDTLETSEIAPTYIIHDERAVSGSLNYGITARMWNESLQGHPPKSHAFKPRILNFQYSGQTIDGDTLYITVDGTNYSNIPSALPIAVFGNTVPYSLSFAQADGLFSYYSKSMSIIEDGIQLEAVFNISPNQYQSLDIRKPIYLNAPEEVQGYWIIDTISDYNPFKLTKVILLKYHNQTPVSIDTDISPPPFPNPTGGDFPYVPSSVISAGTTKGTGENPEKRGVIINNGTGNRTTRGSGSLALGQGCISEYSNQTFIGSYPETTNDKIAIGIGSKEERLTGLRVTTEGDITFYNGEVYIVNTDGERVPVTIDSDNKIKKIYLK